MSLPDERPHRTFRRHAVALLFLTLLSTGTLAAKTAQETSSDAATPEAAAPSQEGLGTDKYDPDDPLQPPDGKWLTDEKGRRYWVYVIPRGREFKDWQWVGDESSSRIRMYGGLELDVVSHDEHTFSVKIYETPAPSKTSKPVGPSQEELAAIAASYVAETGNADRIRLDPYEEGLPRRGQWRNGFDLADMNGDGHLDIVAGPSRKGSTGRPNIFLGNGQGQWSFWDAMTFPDFPFDYGDAAAADLNGDGHQDLVLGIHLKGIIALIGDGQGKFEIWSQGIAIDVPGQGGTASSFSSRALTTTDWNGDGRIDILAYGEGPKGFQKIKLGQSPDVPGSHGLLIYLNNGDGSWTPQLHSKLRPRNFGDSLALGDFNADQLPDVVTSSSLLGNDEMVYLGDRADAWTLRKVNEVRPRAFVRTVAVADLNGDDRDDLAIGYLNNEDSTWRSGIDLLYARQDETWERRPLFSEESREQVQAIATGNLDGDETIDLVALTADQRVLVFRGEPGGFFAREESPELPPVLAGCGGFDVHLADLNGDGRDEIVAGFAGEEVGFSGFPDLFKPGCQDGGSLRAWTPVLLDVKADGPAKGKAKKEKAKKEKKEKAKKAKAEKAKAES